MKFMIKDHLNKVVVTTVQETLNALLAAEADPLCGAKRYEHSAARVDTRAGHYERQLHTKAGEVTLKVPKLRSLAFESASIERYSAARSASKRRWSSCICPARVRAPRRGHRPGAVGHAGESEHRQRVLREGAKADQVSWVSFLRYLKERGLTGVRLFVSDKCLGLIESLVDFYLAALWQRCAVHFYRNVGTAVPTSKVRDVAAMLKAIHAQADLKAAKEKAALIVAKLREMKLAKAVEIVATGIEETLQYFQFPSEHSHAQMCAT